MLSTITLLLLQQACPACPAQAQSGPTTGATVRTLQVQRCPDAEPECLSVVCSQEPGAQAITLEGQNCDLAELERCIAQIECTGTEIENCLAQLELQYVIEQEGNQPQQHRERRMIMVGPDGQPHEMTLDLAMPMTLTPGQQETGPVCSRCMGQMDQPRREVIRLRRQAPNAPQTQTWQTDQGQVIVLQDGQEFQFLPQAHANPHATSQAAMPHAPDRLGMLEQRINDLDIRLARMEELLLQIADR
jgi:hypothetical protein